MAKAAVHTMPTENGGWKNVMEGSDPTVTTYKTKAGASAAGRARAKRTRTEHFVHNDDGKISSRSSFGNDPYPPKG